MVILSYKEWLKDFGYEDNAKSKVIYNEWVDSQYAIMTRTMK